MSRFVYEAFLVGLKEGVKLSVVWFVLYSYLSHKGRTGLIRYFSAGIAFSFFAAGVLFALPVQPFLKVFLSGVISMSFSIFILSSGAALLHTSGTDLSGPFGKMMGRRITAAASATAGVGVIILAIVFFAPDLGGTVLFLKELGTMKESVLYTYLSAASGMVVSLAVLSGTVAALRPFRIGRFFDIPQLLLFLSVVKLTGGGIKGLSEISLIPAIQRGFMKFSHDFIHQTFVIVMVPDHPLLKTTVWNFIGFFFGSNIAIVASLVMLLFFPLLFLYYNLLRPLPEPHADTGAGRRKIKAQLLSERRNKALPVIFFIGLILITWFSGRGEPVSKLYNPKPKPVVEDKGFVIIPINDPTMDLMDGGLHKFSLSLERKEVRLLIIRKDTGRLTVCLDACEICPPDGYGQREDQVVCIYCNTPIPIKTLGEPGGCNPIPLSFTVDDRFVRIEAGEILKKMAFINTGQGKEKAPGR